MLDVRKGIPPLGPVLELPSERFAHCFQFRSGGQLSNMINQSWKIIKTSLSPYTIISSFKTQAHLFVWSGSRDCSIKRWIHRFKMDNILKVLDHHYTLYILIVTSVFFVVYKPVITLLSTSSRYSSWIFCLRVCRKIQKWETVHKQLQSNLLEM